MRKEAEKVNFAGGEEFPRHGPLGQVHPLLRSGTAQDASVLPLRYSQHSSFWSQGLGIMGVGNLLYDGRIAFAAEDFILESYWHHLDLEPNATVEFAKIDGISLASITSGREADYQI